MKKANPKFPILVRECSGLEPKVFARFGEYHMTKFLFNLVEK